jgi:uncharacterized membrane protein YfcA
MSIELIDFLFILLGIFSGLLGGLLGIGGGVVTVPILYFLFQYTPPFKGEIMQVAVSTSLATGFVTSAVATFVQAKKKTIVLAAIQKLAPGLIIGCILGSLLGHYLPSEILSKIFGVMAILIGIYFFFPKLPSLYISSKLNATLSFFGLLIGSLSSLLGIGGGSLAFPVLLGYQMPAKNAAATSSASTLMTCLLGSATYLIIAWDQPDLPNTFGYVDLPAFAFISLGSILSAPLGVKLSHTLNVSFIKQIFGGSLALVGLSMLYRLS